MFYSLEQNSIIIPFLYILQYHSH